MTQKKVWIGSLMTERRKPRSNRRRSRGLYRFFLGLRADVVKLAGEPAIAGRKERVQLMFDDVRDTADCIRVVTLAGVNL